MILNSIGCKRDQFSSIEGSRLIVLTSRPVLCSQRNLDRGQQQDIAAQKFLQMVVWMRAVVLQDLALLVDLQPDVPLWGTEPLRAILEHPQWARFKQTVQVTHAHRGEDDVHDFCQVCTFVNAVCCRHAGMWRVPTTTWCQGHYLSPGGAWGPQTSYF